MQKKLVILFALITTACSSEVTVTTTPKKNTATISAVMPLLDVFEKTSPLLMVTIPDADNQQKGGCTSDLAEITEYGAWFRCTIPLNDLRDDDMAFVQIYADGYFSSDGEQRTVADIRNQEPEYFTEILHARALDGSDWSCLQQGVVNGQPTETKMTLEGAVEITFDNVNQDFELHLVMWEERVRILGDTISGEKELVFYSGDANSTSEFSFLRAAKDDPNDGFQFVCTR
ncbi:MAG: hypothetical protein NUV81_00630 [bacterium]|nr:hypothetical protein [bacterium]